MLTTVFTSGIISSIIGIWFKKKIENENMKILEDIKNEKAKEYKYYEKKLEEYKDYIEALQLRQQTQKNEEIADKLSVARMKVSISGSKEVVDAITKFENNLILDNQKNFNDCYINIINKMRKDLNSENEEVDFEVKKYG